MCGVFLVRSIIERQGQQKDGECDLWPLTMHIKNIQLFIKCNLKWSQSEEYKKSKHA